MITRVSSHQPSFLPWLGFWNKMLSSDVLIHRTGVQFARRDVLHRVTLNGRHLSLHVGEKSNLMPLKDVTITDLPDLKKMAKGLRMELMSKRNKYGYRLEPVVDYLEHVSVTNMVQVNIQLIQVVKSVLDGLVDRPKAWPEEVVYDTFEDVGSRTSRIKDMLATLGKPEVMYLAGAGALNYMSFKDLGCPAMVQRVKEGTCPDTILKTLATCADPVDVIMSCAVWEEVA
jgi:hypothetical protein